MVIKKMEEIEEIIFELGKLGIEIGDMYASHTPWAPR
jgi:hypothetical protein